MAQVCTKIILSQPLVHDYVVWGGATSPLNRCYSVKLCPWQPAVHCHSTIQCKPPTLHWLNIINPHGYMACVRGKAVVLSVVIRFNTRSGIIAIYKYITETLLGMWENLWHKHYKSRVSISHTFRPHPVMHNVIPCAASTTHAQTQHR